MLFEVEDENKDACIADGSFKVALSADDGRGGGVWNIEDPFWSRI
jgi:hypothetical protein